LQKRAGLPKGWPRWTKWSGEVRVADYQPYWAARAGLLVRLGEKALASDAYERAIGLESDPAVRKFLERRRAEL
jgi:RNA polymerase sigma-70 factor (ECF subfamily)